MGLDEDGIFTVSQLMIIDEDGFVIQPIRRRLAQEFVLKYHYSQKMSTGDLRCYGAFEDRRCVGTIVFGPGASPYIGSPFGLERQQVVELVRVAFADHQMFVTQALADAMRQLKESEPAMRLVVSFADERQQHLGKMYQGGNWLYLGTSDNTYTFRIFGEEVHPKTTFTRYGTQSIYWLRNHVDEKAQRIGLPPKHKYVYPLDRGMRRQINKIALPYPCGLSVDGDTSVFQIEDSGSTPLDRSPKMAPTGRPRGRPANKSDVPPPHRTTKTAEEIVRGLQI